MKNSLASVAMEMNTADITAEYYNQEAVMYYKISKVTPQSQPVFGKDMKKNNAGGYVFTLSNFDRLMRFLILGADGGTYYVSKKKLTRDNAKCVMDCIKEDAKRVVDMIVDVSENGRAPKNDPALFALAMVAGLGNAEQRSYALKNLSRVARIGTHLFHFAEYVQNFRGWGHGLRNTIANWYTDKSANDLAFQFVKYQGRDGWTNKDLIRLSHPKANDENQNLALGWAVKGVLNRVDGGDTLNLFNNDALGFIYAFESVKRATTENEVVGLVREYRLPLEAIPTEKQTARVLAAALPNMGVTALIRNLGRFSKEGIFSGVNEETRFVAEKITNAELLKKQKVHPLQILFAMKTYTSGHGFRGTSSWKVVGMLADALDEAFYSSFGAVIPTGARILIADDISGSMDASMIANSNVSAREGATAMSMMIARTEPNYEVVGFTSSRDVSWKSKYIGTKHHSIYGYGSRMNDGLMELDISPRRRLDDICRYTKQLSLGATDCALPFLYALDKGKEFDVVIILTDNETCSGDIHPHQALKMYRDASGINTKLIAVGMTATEYTVADPNDRGSLDVVGFDGSAPQVISNFITGGF